MTDTPTPDAETLMEQLRDPATLLANALRRIHEADALVGDPDECDPGDLDFMAVYKIGSAFVLGHIAKAASDLAEVEQRHTLQVVGNSLDAEDFRPGPAHEYEPQAVSGVRFTADLTGHYVGLVNGQEWLHVPGVGFLVITAAEECTDGRRVSYRMTGRVVSATTDHVLCITDGGTSVTLPRALIMESPDE